MATPHTPTQALRPACSAEHLFGRSRELLCVTDLDGRLCRVNPAMAEALGLDAEALPAQPLFTLVDPDGRWRAQAAFGAAAASGGDQLVTTGGAEAGGARQWVEWQICGDVERGQLYVRGRDVTAERQSAERLRILEVLVEQAAIGMAITDLEGRITYANAAMRATCGYGDATVGMLVPQLIPPDERDDPAARMAELMGAGSVTSEATFIARDGTAHPVQVAALLIRDESGSPQATAAVIRDLSEERARERQLRMFETLVQHMPDAVSVNRLDGRLIYANEAFRSQLGLAGPIEELTMEQLVDPAELPRMRADVWPRMIAGATWRGRTRLRRRDGSSFPTDSLSFAIRDANGEIQGFAGVMHDVTDQERAEQELRLAKFTLERSPDGTYWADSTGALIYANGGASATLGYSREELLGMNIMDIDPAFPTLDWDRDIWQPLKRHRVLSFESTHRRKDGGIMPVDVVAYYVEFEGREYGCSFARDVSERKRVEDERAALQDQIIAAQQAALRELSTPLIPIADGVVAMPLIGSLDSARAQQVIETLLEGVAACQAEVAILNITGVAVVDTQVANALLRAAQAVRLLGTSVVLTGIKPEVAQTLVNLGADLSGIVTRSSLQSGVAYALQGK